MDLVPGTVVFRSGGSVEDSSRRGCYGSESDDGGLSDEFDSGAASADEIEDGVEEVRPERTQVVKRFGGRGR